MCRVAPASFPARASPESDEDISTIRLFRRVRLGELSTRSVREPTPVAADDAAAVR